MIIERSEETDKKSAWKGHTISTDRFHDDMDVFMALCACVFVCINVCSLYGIHVHCTYKPKICATVCTSWAFYFNPCDSSVIPVSTN